VRQSGQCPQPLSPSKSLLRFIHDGCVIVGDGQIGDREYQKLAWDTAANPSVQALALISNDTCLVGVVDRSVQSGRTPIPPEKEARGMNVALLNNNSLILWVQQSP
jgi:hypothetical protein